MMGITPVNEPITLYALTPHMHLRGKSMKWWVTYPDGREEVILDVPNFDFNWQIQYELATPLQRARPAARSPTWPSTTTRSNNRWNPAPEKEVYWSEQSWDEMYQPTTQFSVDSRTSSRCKRPTTEQQQQPVAARALHEHEPGASRPTVRPLVCEAESCRAFFPASRWRR